VIFVAFSMQNIGSFNLILVILGISILFSTVIKVLNNQRVKNNSRGVRAHA